jgi:hypothetical protein
MGKNVFFSNDNLNDILNDEDNDDDYKEEIKKLWESKKIKFGESLPVFAPEALAEELELSGFGWDNSHSIPNAEYWTIGAEPEITKSNEFKSNQSKSNEPPRNYFMFYVLSKLLRISGFLLLIVYAFSHIKAILITGIIAIVAGLLMKIKNKTYIKKDR